MDIKLRLRQYLSHKQWSVRELERRCGLSNGVASRLSNTTNPSTLKKIVDNCDINLKWLLSGEGEMLRSTMDAIEVAKDGRLIPFYDAETTGGANGLVSSSDLNGGIVGYIQPGTWFDCRETAAIRHVGDSMVEYPNGCILALREVSDRHLLVPGRNYVVETSEYRVTKRVQLGSEKGLLALYSTNQERYPDGRLIYEPFEVSTDDIRHIFSVLGYIVNQSGEMKFIRP